MSERPLIECMQGIAAAFGGAVAIAAAGAGMLGYGVPAMIGGAILIAAGTTMIVSAVRENRRNKAG
ncbi:MULTISPECIES: hypothetical protein [unclassified Bradyrhizobium]|uniref:hypothetical protein n=1 Tax=unclassified Bradyrhizobium TaxID=2631580 RepID=UPI002915DA8A|nr:MULTISPECIES: hypothetical protein [unclassified Bradyrhizobium]